MKIDIREPIDPYEGKDMSSLVKSRLVDVDSKSVKYRKFMGVFSAFREGLARHGIFSTTSNSSSFSDLVVQWGHRNIPRSDACNNYLIIEHGYYNNRLWGTYSIGFNGLNGEANFVNQESDGNRWAEEDMIKPWITRDNGYVLVIGQTPEDATLFSKTLDPVDIDLWVQETKQQYEAMGHDVRIRFHPNVVPPERTLQQEFDEAKLVVTCSSNTGVEAVMAGIPTVATYPTSMVYKLCKHTTTPDREQWCKNLSYCQWTEEEIRRGDAWEHLKRFYTE